MIIKSMQPTSYGLFYGPTLLTTSREISGLKHWANKRFTTLGEPAMEAGLTIKAMESNGEHVEVQFVCGVCEHNQEHYWRGAGVSKTATFKELMALCPATTV